ncbi:MAG: Vms1/Ankzf1 family peptidyl-tRNA hydrolase [Vicinamibacterales bacterium]
MSVTDQLDRLAALEPAPYPVVSLYLNTQPGQTGRDQYQTFVRKEFSARSRTYPPHSPERECLEQDLDRISRYLETELQPSANGVAIFACSAGELFEAVQLTAPIEQHWLYIGDRPHLYPLARVESLYPRYAVVLANTNTARILVVSTGAVVTDKEITGTRTRRTTQGGWSQARFQRHIENFHLQHAKEVIDALDRIVQVENIENIVIAGDEVIVPLLREQMPKHLAERIVDHIRVDKDGSLDDVVKTSLDAMQRVREQTERDKVEAAVGGYRAGALGVVGPEDTLDALIKGQVDELLLAANLNELQALSGGKSETSVANDAVLQEPMVEPVHAGEAAAAPPETVRLADELVAKAAQTSARITFIQDPDLLSAYGGVAALLRFRI